MPQQLIYTSAPRGLVAGRSGYCTVARSATMREALMLRLEQFSYYDHLSLVGGTERPVLACRVIDLRGTRYHVLSRIQDADLDFTGRTNFIAHHLVVTPEEVSQMPTPAMAFRKWAGWISTWSGEPQLLNNEDWSGLTDLSTARCLPARAWAGVAGDPVHAYGLLEAKSGSCFCPENATDDTLLTLLAESTELLEVRDSRRDFRAAAWEWTFTTSSQEQDNPADFRWRFVRRDHPAFAKQAGSGCVSLPSVRAARFTEEEKLFAQKGWQPVQNVSVKPSAHLPIQEGEKGYFQAEADGVPYPSYQWYEIDISTRQPKPIKGATGPGLEVQPRRGVARYRVEAFNQAGGSRRTSPEVSVEVRAAYNTRWEAPPKPAGPVKRKTSLVSIDDDEESLERKQRNVEKAEEIGRKLREQQERGRTVKWAVISTAILALLILLLIAWKQGWFMNRKDSARTMGASTNQAPPDTAAKIQSVGVTDAVTNPAASPGTAAVRAAEPPTNIDSAATSAPTNKEVLSAANTEDEQKGLPKPWRAKPIGFPEKPDVNFYPETGAFVITGGGSGLTGENDRLSFVYQQVSSDGVLEARFLLNPRMPPPTGSQFGIMMRESEKVNARFVFVGFSKINMGSFHAAYSRGDKSEPAAQNTNIPWYGDVFHCQLKRDGHTYQASYKDPDGRWKLLTKLTNTMGTNYLVGIVACPGGTNRMMATFDQVHWTGNQETVGSQANRKRDK